MQFCTTKRPQLCEFEVASCRTCRLRSKKAILEVATSNLQKRRGFAQSWGPCMPIWHLLIGWSLNKYWSLRDTNRWKVRKKFSFMIFFLHSASHRGHNEYTDSGWTRTWKNIRAKIYSRIDWTSYWSQKKISRPGFGFWICPIYAIFCLCWLHVLRRLLSWQWGTGVPECIQVSIIAIFMHTYIKSFLKQPPLKVMELRQTLANGKILNHKRLLGSCCSKGEIWLLST